MRRTAFPPLPVHADPALRAWARVVEAQLAVLPDLSLISTSDGPNSSGISADLGTLAIDIGSSTTRLWQKRSGSTSTTGWSSLSWI